MLNSILEKISNLLALATPEEVKNLENALAMVMPQNLLLEKLDIRVAWGHKEDYVNSSIAFLIAPAHYSEEPKGVIPKLRLIFEQATPENYQELHHALDTILETAPKRLKLHVSPVTVMSPKMLACRFYFQTIDPILP